MENFWCAYVKKLDEEEKEKSGMIMKTLFGRLFRIDKTGNVQNVDKGWRWTPKNGKLDTLNEISTLQ